MALGSRWQITWEDSSTILLIIVISICSVTSLLFLIVSYFNYLYFHLYRSCSSAANFEGVGYQTICINCTQDLYINQRRILCFNYTEIAGFSHNEPLHIEIVGFSHNEPLHIFSHKSQNRSQRQKVWEAPLFSSRLCSESPCNSIADLGP